MTKNTPTVERASKLFDLIFEDADLNSEAHNAGLAAGRAPDENDDGEPAYWAAHSAYWNTTISELIRQLQTRGSSIAAPIG